MRKSTKPLLILAVALLSAAAARSATQDPGTDDRAVFATAEAAVDALLAAARDNDREAMERIFGSEHWQKIETDDDAAERERARMFWEEAQVLRMLEERAEDERVLVVGRDLWPFPIPIVRGEAGWQFDTEEGYEEIIDRRIGANELNAIAACREYVLAQFEYAGEDRDGDLVREFAQRVRSSPGTQDGLYWPTEPGAPESPLGELVAESEPFIEADRPFMGYHFRILTAQGANPPEGAYDYVINGNMIAGFALIAFPAEHGSTGVMTFVVSHRGEVHDKDLGPESIEAAARITTYDPGDSWTLVTD